MSSTINFQEHPLQCTLQIYNCALGGVPSPHYDIIIATALSLTAWYQDLVVTRTGTAWDR